MALAELLLTLETEYKEFKNEYEDVWACFSDNDLIHQAEAARRKVLFIKARVDSMREDNIK